MGFSATLVMEHGGGRKVEKGWDLDKEHVLLWVNCKYLSNVSTITLESTGFEISATNF